MEDCLKSGQNRSRREGKIAFFVHSWFPNHQALIDQIDTMCSCRVRYCVLSQSDRNRAWDEWNGLRVVPTVLPGLQIHFQDHQLNLNYGVHKYFRTEPPALVVTKGWGDPAYLLAQRFAWERNIPIITWMCGRDTRDTASNSLLRWLSSAVARTVIKKSRFVFVYGSQARHDALELGAREEDVVIVRHCIDESHFDCARLDSSRPDKSFARKQLGLGAGPLFLCVSQLIPRKGIQDLLCSFDLLRHRRHDAQFLIIGKGELASEVEEFGLKHRGHFAWLPSVPYAEMPDYYAIADYFVLATHLDAWATVINESHCSKLPVISSNAAHAVDDLVEHGRTGLVYPAGNVNELAERMLYALDHPNEMKQMAENGYHLIKTSWNLQESARIWAEHTEIALREPYR